MIRAVLLDCFGVMYFERTWGGHHPYVSSSDPDVRDLAREAEYGLIDGDTLHRGIAELTAQPLAKIERHLADEYTRNTALLSYAQTLRSEVKVAVLSNLGPDTMQQFFTSAERTELFDGFFVSSEVGMIKPHPEIFEYACNQLGVDTSEAVMLDDLEENCVGAREAGLQAICFRSTEQAIADLNALLGTVE